MTLPTVPKNWHWAKGTPEGGLHAWLQQLRTVANSVSSVSAVADAAETPSGAQAKADAALVAAKAYAETPAGAQAKADAAEADAKTYASTLAYGSTLEATNAVIDARTGSGERPVGRDELAVNVEDYAHLADAFGLNWAPAYQGAIDAAAELGLPLLASARTRRFTESVTAPSGVTVRGDGKDSAVMVDGNFPAFIVEPGANGVHFDSVGFLGTMPVNNVATIQNQVGIKAYGEYDNPITNFRVTSCTFDRIQGTAIQMRMVNRFRVRHNDITHHGYAAIGCHSVRDGLIEKNDIIGTGNNPAYVSNTYGIYVSTLESYGPVGSTENPHSEDVMVRSNKVTNQLWSSLDTHVGRRISFVNNQIRNCLGSAINAVYIDAGGNADNALLSPQDILIEGNIITYDSLIEPSSAMNMAILLRGSISTNVAARQRATGVIRGNIIRRHGRQDSSTSGAIFIGCGTGIIVDGNTLHECRSIGVHVYDCRGAVISNNTFVDLWRSTGSATAIFTNLQLEPEMDLTVTGNRFVRGALTPGVGGLPAGASINNSGINGTNSANVKVVEGNNSWGVASFAANHERSQNVTTNRRIVDGTAPPTTGTWLRGERVRNITPAAGGWVEWVCVVGGTPGTWRGAGPIEA